MEKLHVDFITAKNLVVDKLQTWFELSVQMLPNLLVSAMTLLVFALLARLAGRITGRLSLRWSRSRSLTSLVGTLTRITIFVVGVFVALTAMELDKTVTSLLAGAGILGLAIGFAFQDIVENLISGLILGFRRPFKVGDVISSNGTMGTVRTINLRNTIVENFDGQRVLIPNKKVFNDKLVNYSAHGFRRVEVSVGVEYSADLQQVTAVLRKALLGIDNRRQDKGVQIVCREFGDSSIDFVARFWIPYPGADYFEALHEGHLAIKTALDDAGFTIPFPIRTLEIAQTEVRPKHGQADHPTFIARVTTGA